MMHFAINNFTFRGKRVNVGAQLGIKASIYYIHFSETTGLNRFVIISVKKN